MNKSSSGPALEEQAAVGYRVPIQFEQALDAAKRKNIDDERRIKELLLEIGGLNKKLAGMEMAWGMRDKKDEEERLARGTTCAAADAAVDTAVVEIEPEGGVTKYASALPAARHAALHSYAC